MANRDLNFIPDVAPSTPELPDNSVANAIESVGTTLADQSAQSKLLSQSAKAQVGFKQLDAQFRMKYADDPTNKDGLQELAEQRAMLSDSLGEAIPSLYTRQWQNKTTELSTSSDVSNELWTAHQQRLNTVTNVNGSIKTYLDAGNKDGQAFGASDAVDVGGALNYINARQNIEQFGNPALGTAKTEALLKDFNKDYVKSFVSGVAETSPAKAVKLLESPDIQQHFTTEERGDMISQIARVKKQQALGKQLTTTINDTGLTDVVNDDNSTYYEKRAQIDRLDMAGAITPTAAAKARRVIKSTADLDSQTDTPVMASIINQIYDLNANSQSSSSDYLRGVQNVQEAILEKQADGQLTAPDAGKLNKQLVTLTNKRISDATQQVGNEFYEANQQFQVLPPEYRGDATRKLFYAADGKNFTKQQYKATAQTIVDDLNAKRRAAAMKIVNDSAKNDTKFLTSIKATPDDVKATALKYHVSEAEVMRQLRMRSANRHMNVKPVTTIDSGDGTIPDATPSQPVVLQGADGEDAGDTAGESGEE